MTTLAIQLLGNFHITYNGEPITTLTVPRLQNVFAYLVLHRETPQPRQQMAFHCWPDSSEGQALTNLRKQLLYLRKALPSADDFLLIKRHTIQLLPTAAITVDVELFSRQLTKAHQASPALAIPALRQAVDLYEGELLPGCYDDWLLAERERLHSQFLAALDRLIQALVDQRKNDEAIAYAQQRLRYDPLHELTYRQLMQLYMLKQDRPGAIQVYQSCVTQLQNELGVEPAAETQAIYKQLLQQATAIESTGTPKINAPFVGRQAEWQTLQQIWRAAQRVRPQFVLITGEAGIGKTRLAEELLTWAHYQNVTTARTRSYAAEARLAYAPVVEWLRSEPFWAELHHLDSAWLTELARLVPEILTTYPHVPPPGELTPSWQRRQLFEAPARAFLATRRPLLLLLDDLQWCDQDTIEWLHFFLRFDRRARCLLLATARTEELHGTRVNGGHPLAPLLTNLRNETLLTELELAPLNEAETTKLATELTVTAPTPYTLTQLYDHTGGNPLFIVETVRSEQWLAMPAEQSPTIGAHALIVNLAMWMPCSRLKAIMRSA